MQTQITSTQPRMMLIQAQGGGKVGEPVQLWPVGAGRSCLGVEKEKVVTFAIARCVMALASAACGNRPCYEGMC